MGVLEIAILVVALSCVFGKNSDYPSYKIDEAPHIKFPGVVEPRFDGYPAGHKQWFGMQRPALGQVPEYFETPTPRELWDNHVKTYRPAVIRGALHGSSALDNWSDEYLIKHYGDQEVLVEKKLEDRLSEPKRMSIEGFLKGYKQHNWYVVSMMPDVMRKELRVPKSLMCSVFRENLQELNLWLGTRGTRSILHFDADNILHCLVAGRKDWILIHPDYKPQIDMVLGERGQGSGFSHIKVDEVDTTKYRELSQVPWEYASLYAGDCLYLPPQYLHQVRSFNRSISATYLFYPRDYFYDGDCEGVDLDGYLGLDKVYVAWTYVKNQETVDMGYQNPVNVKKSFMHYLDVTKTTWLTYKQFAILQVSTQGEQLLGEKSYALKYFTREADLNKDKNVTIDELKQVDIEVWKEWCRKNESPHGPTKSELNVNDKKTNASAGFNPRDNDYFVDAKDTLRFLKQVIKRIGKNNTLSFPVFKERVRLGKGLHSEAFLLLDTNMNGFISLKEIEALDLKFIRDFQKTVSSYLLAETDLGGGGNFEEDFRDGVSSEDEVKKSHEKLRQYVKELKDAITKMEVQKMVEEGLVKYITKHPLYGNKYLYVKQFAFHLMDKGQKGYITPDDLTMYIEDSAEIKAAFPANPDDAPVVKKDRTTLEPPIRILNQLLSTSSNVERHLQRRKMKRRDKDGDESDDDEDDDGESDDDESGDESDNERDGEQKRDEL